MGGTWDIIKLIREGNGRAILKEKNRRPTLEQNKAKQQLKRLQKKRRKGR